MPKLSVQVPHRHGTGPAVERLHRAMQDALPAAGDKVTDLKTDWTANRCEIQFKVMGMAVKGHVLVTEETVALNADLPFAATFFMAKIESDAKTRLAAILS